MTEPLGARPARPLPVVGRGATNLAVGLLVIALLATGLIIRDSQVDARAKRDAELLTAAEATADFTRVAVEELGRRQAIAAQNGMTGVASDEDLTSIAATLGVGFALVLGEGGELLAAHPARELDGPELVAQFPHLAQALEGRVGVSAVLEAPSFPSGIAIAVAAPFLGDDGGRRVLSTAFDRDATVLGGQLRNVRVTDGSTAWLIDEVGGIVAQGREGFTPPQPGPPGISSTMTDAGEMVLARVPVEDTPWSVVVMAPHAELHANVLGWNLWRPWLLLAVALGAAAALMVLARRNRRVSLELEQANLDLEATADRMRDFVAVAAHELRTPASVILGFAKVIDRSYDTMADEDRARVQGSLVRASERLAQLTDELLTQATADRGQLAVAPVEVELAHALTEAVAASPLHEADVDVQANGIRVLADPEQLRRILVSLLDNADKYGSAPVSLTATRVGGRALIKVADAGPGVPAEFEDALFERFARAPSIRKQSRIPGTGLGLSLARAIAEELGGSLDHEPTEVGACFVLRLPLAE